MSLLAYACSGSANAQSPAPARDAGAYPNRPIRFVVAFPPGASTDIVARIVGAKLSESWGQNVVIENRSGAGGNIGTQTAARANPDGYTILMNSSAFVVNVSLYSKPGYTIADFAPVVQGPTTPNLISVNPAVKANTLKEVIAFAKAAPTSYGSSGTGTTPHLDAELIFKALAKIDITHVPYGPAQAVTAVIGNQVPIASTSMPPAVPHVKANRVRPIAVTTAKRSAILPDVPTVAESGFSGFNDHTWFSFFRARRHAVRDRCKTQWRDQSRDAIARCKRAAGCAVAGVRAQYVGTVRNGHQGRNRALCKDGEAKRRKGRLIQHPLNDVNAASPYNYGIP